MTTTTQESAGTELIAGSTLVGALFDAWNELDLGHRVEIGIPLW